jgi:hypothetical protein
MINEAGRVIPCLALLCSKQLCLFRASLRRFVSVGMILFFLHVALAVRLLLTISHIAWETAKQLQRVFPRKLPRSENSPKFSSSLFADAYTCVRVSTAVALCLYKTSRMRVILAHHNTCYE